MLRQTDGRTDGKSDSITQFDGMRTRLKWDKTASRFGRKNIEPDYTEWLENRLTDQQNVH
jgi:hypothetical protein